MSKRKSRDPPPQRYSDNGDYMVLDSNGLTEDAVSKDSSTTHYQTSMRKTRKTTSQCVSLIEGRTPHHHNDATLSDSCDSSISELTENNDDAMIIKTLEEMLGETTKPHQFNDLQNFNVIPRETPYAEDHRFMLVEMGTRMNPIKVTMVQKLVMPIVACWKLVQDKERNEKDKSSIVDTILPIPDEKLNKCSEANSWKLPTIKLSDQYYNAYTPLLQVEYESVFKNREAYGANSMANYKTINAFWREGLLFFLRLWSLQPQLSRYQVILKGLQIIKQWFRKHGDLEKYINKVELSNILASDIINITTDTSQLDISYLRKRVKRYLEVNGVTIPRNLANDTFIPWANQEWTNIYTMDMQSEKVEYWKQKEATNKATKTEEDSQSKGIDEEANVKAEEEILETHPHLKLSKVALSLIGSIDTSTSSVDTPTRMENNAPAPRTTKAPSPARAKDSDPEQAAIVAPAPDAPGTVRVTNPRQKALKATPAPAPSTRKANPKQAPKATKATPPAKSKASNDTHPEKQQVTKPKSDFEQAVIDAQAIGVPVAIFTLKEKIQGIDALNMLLNKSIELPQLDKVIGEPLKAKFEAVTKALGTLTINPRRQKTKEYFDELCVAAKRMEPAIDEFFCEFHCEDNEKQGEKDENEESNNDEDFIVEGSDFDEVDEVDSIIDSEGSMPGDDYFEPFLKKNEQGQFLVPAELAPPGKGWIVEKMENYMGIKEFVNQMICSAGTSSQFHTPSETIFKDTMVACGFHDKSSMGESLQGYERVMESWMSPTFVPEAQKYMCAFYDYLTAESIALGDKEFSLLSKIWKDTLQVQDRRRLDEYVASFIKSNNLGPRRMDLLVKMALLAGAPNDVGENANEDRGLANGG